MDQVQIGREMVVAESSGALGARLRQYRYPGEHREKDYPPHRRRLRLSPPISGWIEARGVVVETTPNGDQSLMGEAANQESLARDPRGPVNGA